MDTHTSLHFQIFDQNFVTEQTITSLNSNPFNSSSLNSVNHQYKNHSSSSIDNDFVYSATVTNDNLSIYDPSSPPAKSRMKKSNDDNNNNIISQYNLLLKQYKKVQESNQKNYSQATQDQDKISKLHFAIQEKDSIIQKYEHQIKLFKHSLIDYECNKLRDLKTFQIQQVEFDTQIKTLQTTITSLQLTILTQSEQIIKLQQQQNEQQSKNSIKPMESKLIQSESEFNSILFKSYDDQQHVSKSEQVIDIFADNTNVKLNKLEKTINEIHKNSLQNECMMKMWIQFFKEITNSKQSSVQPLSNSIDTAAVSAIQQQLQQIYQKQQEYLSYLVKQLEVTQGVNIQLYDQNTISKTASNISNMQDISIRCSQIYDNDSSTIKLADRFPKRNTRMLTQNKLETREGSNSKLPSKYQKKTSVYSFNPLELKIIKKEVREDNNNPPKSSETLRTMKPF